MKGKRQRPAIIDQATKSQTITNMQTSKAARVQRQQQIQRTERHKRCFFNLGLYEEKADGWAKETQVLQAGQKYEVMLTCSKYRSHSNQQEIEATGAFELRLDCRTDGIIPVTIPIEDALRSYERILTTQEYWIIHIPANCPSCKLTFSLAFKGHNMRAIHNIVTRTYSIESNGTLKDPELLEVYQIATETSDSIAVLAISSHPLSPQKHTFKIRGWNNQRRLLLEEASTSETIVNVAELMQRKDDPVTIFGKIRIFSETALPSFKAWLQSLYQQHKENLCLVFIDTTPLEIPWEMFELDDYLYIGALAKVVRWVPLQPANKCPLHVKDEYHEGSIIAYIDQNLGEHETREEHKVLEEVAIKYQTLGSLERRMHKSLQKIGLIYVGCHGNNGSTLKSQYPDQLTATKLAMIQKHPEPRPVAFINACESGRIVRNNEWGDHSFVEILLYRCVRGYIGTLGKVGTEYASYIAKRILELAQCVDGLQFAEILRRLRDEAVQQLRNSHYQSEIEQNEIGYKALYTFMYVYYGNPLARFYLRNINHEEEGT